MEIWRNLGDLHPKLVQFPLVLLLVGLTFDLLGVIWKSRRAHWAGLMTTGMGTIGLLFAFICGIYAEVWAGRAGIPQHPIELHELMANIASWGLVILFAWRLLMSGSGQRSVASGQMGAENAKSPSVGTSASPRWIGLYLIVGFAWYALLVLTGYLGGQLVFQYGAGITGLAGAANGTTLTLEDLNTLASRQTDENLRYSEWMHHIFGWMTLGLGMSLLAQAIWPAQRKKLTWIVPVFLLIGGIFLFFMADRDLYALTDWRQFRDREVQLHKTLAIVMATVGAVGLWKLRGKAAKAKTEPAEKENPKGGNSKLVAVLALIGGSMLFTHVHTVAPYANVAAGVYIAHVVMGLVALAIGGARLAQDYVKRAGPQKFLAVAFAGFMLAEAVLLIYYNEGLPWFIGYGQYNRWGPNEDRSVTIAPFGNFRAAMSLDQNSGNVFIAFRDRFTDDPVRLVLDSPPTLLVARGYEETAIPLAKSVIDGESVAKTDDWTGSNFRGEADFLKTAPLVSARLVIHLHGEREVGYFDPWVTPSVNAIPANELAKYECPMHEGVRSLEPGKCPLCGMEMVPILPPRPAGTLHDANYDLRLIPEETAGSPDPFLARFFIDPTKGDAHETVKDLALVHGQPMHLIVVSENLSYFDHVHPLPAEGNPARTGFYSWSYRFPHAGRFALFVDLTPSGDRNQVFRIPLEVASDGTVRQLPVGSFINEGENRIALDEAAGKLVSTIMAPQTPQDSAPWIASVQNSAGSAADVDPPILAELIPQPRTIYAGLHTELVFRMRTADGKPLTNLVPYIGAMGHCVIVSQDTADYIHCHPEQLLTPGPDEKGGPDVAFHAEFPKAGRYRIWGQFERSDGRLIIAAFTVDVHEPPVPASLIRFLLNE